MNNESAVAILGALAHHTRLNAFQLLISHTPHGMPAGEVARQLNVPQNTMSVHLATLARAGLIRSERHSRHKIYHADCERLRALTLFLADDCCTGKAEVSFTPLKDVSV
ncbi:ArsR/SmtB family transcription factor [Pseudomonas sp. BGr12]|uniref:ArsR/SmtB family transcription factor n=1 Tax=Pseudomonas sp. BGr12 TaxID=2936269 RepID=UPI002559E831|nr:helix-turn-helix transcriptional regulator [Pseudomonas sp. BJa5]MDL2430907.1 ArsR family transcriptional regulator [Pseudomonas sp. BJa5]